jgi:hypothetical protein
LPAPDPLPPCDEADPHVFDADSKGDENQADDQI